MYTSIAPLLITFSSIFVHNTVYGYALAAPNALPDPAAEALARALADPAAEPQVNILGIIGLGIGSTDTTTAAKPNTKQCTSGRATLKGVVHTAIVDINNQPLGSILGLALGVNVDIKLNLLGVVKVDLSLGVNPDADVTGCGHTTNDAAHRIVLFQLEGGA